MRCLADTSSAIVNAQTVLIRPVEMDPTKKGNFAFIRRSMSLMAELFPQFPAGASCCNRYHSCDANCALDQVSQINGR